MLVRSLPTDTPAPHEVLKRVGGVEPRHFGGPSGVSAGAAGPPAPGAHPPPRVPRRGMSTPLSRKGRGSRRRPVQCRRLGGLVPSCGRPSPAHAADDPGSLPVVPAPLGRAQPSAPPAADASLGFSGSERLR